MTPMRLGRMMPWSPVSNKAIQVFLPHQSSPIYMDRYFWSLVPLENRKTLTQSLIILVLESAGIGVETVRRIWESGGREHLHTSKQDSLTLSFEQCGDCLLVT